ncbi:MAG: hypothetical protein AAF512_04985, partial [Pseudomonadota bacterium]
MSDGTETLLEEIESFCRARGMAESTFGRVAVNNGKLCARLRDGKNVTLATATRIRDYIAGQTEAPSKPPRLALVESSPEKP